LKKTGPLPSVEEKLKVLDAALVALERPGLRAVEISRLHNIIMGVKVYQQLFADFVNYRGLESEVVELRRQLAAEKTRNRTKFPRTFNSDEIQSHWRSLREEYLIHQASKIVKLDAVRVTQQSSSVNLPPKTFHLSA
jgi:hypothetical protein